MTTLSEETAMTTLNVRRYLFGGIAALFLCVSQNTSATLLGDTISASVFSPSGGLISGSTVVVDPGVEFTGTGFGFLNDIWTIDVFGNNTFELKVQALGNISGGDGGIWALTDLDWVGNPGQIIGVNLLSSVDATFANPGIAFTADSISITQGNLSLANGAFTSGTFEILTEHIPEPATITLLGLGLAGIGYRRQRSSKKAV